MFDWERILVNDQPLAFLWEVGFRSLMMFIVLLIVLKLAGKRGIKQLSIFELVIIIALGSAAGDPMFYEDVGLIHGTLVLLVVLLLYRGLTWITNKSPRIEKFLEGRPECLLSEGQLTRDQFAGNNLGRDEFFSTLRMHSIEHLGQVKKAYLETSGDVSVFFYDDDEVKPGLPIMLELLQRTCSIITEPSDYACCSCGAIEQLTRGEHTYTRCDGHEWITPLATKRIG